MLYTSRQRQTDRQTDRQTHTHTHTHTHLVAVPLLSYFSSQKVCQGLGQGVNCGLYERPVFILQQTDPLMFTIEYPGGVSWRWGQFQILIWHCYNPSWTYKLFITAVTNSKMLVLKYILSLVLTVVLLELWFSNGITLRITKHFRNYSYTHYNNTSQYLSLLLFWWY